MTKLISAKAWARSKKISASAKIKARKSKAVKVVSRAKARSKG